MSKFILRNFVQETILLSTYIIRIQMWNLWNAISTDPDALEGALNQESDITIGIFEKIITDKLCHWRINLLMNFIFLDTTHYGNTGCRVFMRRIQNEKDFWLKINIPKGTYWILRIGVVASCQKLCVIFVIMWFKK